MSKRESKWCKWCGEDIPHSTKTEGDFCNANCCREFYLDLGGFDWAFDLIDGFKSAGEIPSTASSIGGEARRFSINVRRE